MPGNDLIFYGTTGVGGGADGGSQPDPNEWLGRFRASQTLHEFQSTITTAQTARERHLLTDSARIGDGADVHALKWLVMQTGAAAPFASRIMAFDTATGQFKLEQRTPATVLIGNFYGVFPRENLFPDVTIDQARNGDTRFRCLSFRNEHGVTIPNVKIHFQALKLNGSEVARFHQVQDPPLQPFLQRSDDVTDLFDAFGQRVPEGAPDNFIGSGGWISPPTNAIADTTAANIANTFSIGCWLRRVIPPEEFGRRRSVAIMIVGQSTLGGSSPDPLAGAGVFSFDILGETPVTTIETDRHIYISGGARLKGTIADSAGPVPGKPGRFAVRAGDQGVIQTDDDPTTDFATTNEDGEAFGTFIAPVNPAFEGDLTHPQWIVGDGDEVGNP